MIDLAAARAIAQGYVDQLRESSGSDVVIAERDTMERPFGWVFFYNARASLETGDTMAGLAGNAPLIVDRETGEMHETGTAHPVEHYLREYEEARRAP